MHAARFVAGRGGTGRPARKDPLSSSDLASYDPFSNLGSSLASGLASPSDVSPRIGQGDRRNSKLISGQGDRRNSNLISDLQAAKAVSHISDSRRPSLLESIPGASARAPTPSGHRPRASPKRKASPDPFMVEGEDCEAESSEDDAAAVEAVHPGSGTQSATAPASENNFKQQGSNQMRGGLPKERSTEKPENTQSIFPLRRLMNILREMLQRGKVDLALNLLNYIFDQGSIASLLELPIAENLLDFTKMLAAFMNSESDACSAYFEDMEVNIISGDGASGILTSKICPRSYTLRRAPSSYKRDVPVPSESQSRRISLIDVLGVTESRRGSRRGSRLDPESNFPSKPQSRKASLQVEARIDHRQELRIPSPVESRRVSEMEAEITLSPPPETSPQQNWPVQPHELHKALLRTSKIAGDQGTSGDGSPRDSLENEGSLNRSIPLDEMPLPPPDYMDSSAPAPPGAAPPLDVNLADIRAHTSSGTPHAWDQSNPNLVSRFAKDSQVSKNQDTVEFDSASDASMVEDGDDTDTAPPPDVLQANLECDIADAEGLISQTSDPFQAPHGSATDTTYHASSKRSTPSKDDAGDSGRAGTSHCRSTESDPGRSMRACPTGSINSTGSRESETNIQEKLEKAEKASMPKRGTCTGANLHSRDSVVKRGHLPTVALTAIIGVQPGDNPCRLMRSKTQPVDIRNFPDEEEETVESQKPTFMRSKTQQVLKETRFLVPHRTSTTSMSTDDSSETSSESDRQVVRPGTSDEGILSNEPRGIYARQDDPEEMGIESANFSRRLSKFVEKRRETITAIFKEQLNEDRAQFLGTASHKYVVHPSGSFRMAWDIAALIIILMESVILPLGLCFEIYPHEAVLWISTGFFVPDIILNFLTGFYHNGLLIMRQRAIVKHYCLGWFLIDFLSTVPWEVCLKPLGGESATEASFMLKLAKVGKLMRVLRLLRVLKLKSLLERVEDMFSSYIVLFTLSITKTVAVYCLFCHWTACAWGWLGAYDGTEIPYVRTRDCEFDGPCEKGIGINSSPWRRRYGLQDAGDGDQYLTALQFAAGLLTGAELPLSPGWWCERLFLTVMMIVSFLVCSMIISQIVVVMEKINQDNAEYIEQTRTIRDFMVARGMPMRLQTKVRRYLEYQFKSRKVVHQNHEVMMKLSPFLRIEIQEHMNRTVLENHPFFAGMERSLLSHVCSIPHSMLYAPGDIVCRKGQLCSSMCFILRGQLQIVDARDGFFIFIRAPAWTCDRGLFVTYAITHTINCCMHSELLSLRQQDLINLVNDFPSSQNYIKEYCQRVVDNDPSVSFCDYCRRVGHDLDTCEELTCLVNGEVPHKLGGRSSLDSNETLTEKVSKGIKNGWRTMLRRSKTKAQLVVRNMNKSVDFDEQLTHGDDLTEGAQGIQAKSLDTNVIGDLTGKKRTADALNAWGDV